MLLETALTRFHEAMFLAPLLRLLLPKLFAFVTLTVCVIGAEVGNASLPFLSPIFSDHMVLQRDKENTFWGWTSPGEKVRVEINGEGAEGTAGTDGRWQVRLQPPAVGTPCTVTVSGKEKITLNDVLVGDVWLCGGQSNMQWGLVMTTDGEALAAAANHPNLRLYTVGVQSAYSPRETVKGEWSVCTPESVSKFGGFSAVAYHFARRVQKDVDVPIGLIQDCLGGTPVESWMSPEAIAQVGGFDEPLKEIERLKRTHKVEYGNYIMHWYDEYDQGLKGKAWSDADVDTSDWKPVTLPGAFGQLGLADVPAVVYLTREIELPDPLPPGPVTLRLGVVEKMDTSFINGKWIGASSWVENPRVYRVNREVLRPGKNVVTLRILKIKSQESFLSDPGTLALAFADGPSIPLKGEWKAKVSVDARPPHPLPLAFENYPTMPTVLYQGMIDPITPLALRGFLWYQGEANASRAVHYEKLLTAMIADWRKAFGQGDLPFYIAGLPAFQQRKEKPGSDDWAELREAQLLTAAHVPNSAVATLIDTGDANDIHPREKRPAGQRLGLLALANTYDKPVVSSGPVFDRAEPTGGSIRIHFRNTDRALVLRIDASPAFAVAGEDRVWHWAQARLEGNTVVVSSPEVKEPVAVRYAWQANPPATLFNVDELPAPPFRSDDWPGVTANAKMW